MSKPPLDGLPAAGMLPEGGWAAQATGGVAPTRWSALLFKPAAWIPVLILQTALALRGDGPISTDEATYLVAGHQLWESYLGGPSADNFGTYFSGIPGLYPVFGAAIDQVAGIDGARFFSLLCMLLVNMCLYLISVRLFGRTVAVFASLLFALSSSASFLGWYATFDAPSLALLAVATLLAFQAAERMDVRRLLAIGVLLLLAVAVKYVALEYVPAVIGLLVIRSYRFAGTRQLLIKLAVVAAAGIGTAALTVTVMSPNNWIGLLSTSSAGRRILNQADRLDVLWTGVSYIGLWLLFSLIGLIICWAQCRFRWESVLMFCTGLLPIATHVVLTEATSLHKHTAFGFFFAAPLAGLAVATAFSFGRLGSTRANALAVAPALPAIEASTGGGGTGGGGTEVDGAEVGGTEPVAPRPTVRRRTALGASVPILAAVLLFAMLGTGMATASTMKFGWPEQDTVVAAIDPYVTSSGRYLTDSAGIPSYLFADRTEPYQWTSPWYFEYPTDGQELTGDAALQRAISDKYFDLIAYRPQTFTDAQRQLLLPSIEANYQVVSQVNYDDGKSWYVWVRT
jgi:hypothetical protein